MNPASIQHPLNAVRPERVDASSTTKTYEWRQMLGLGLIVIGVLAVGVGWFGVSGESEPWKQMPFLASGGIGGAAAIAIGITCLISFEHASDRRVLLEVLDRLEVIELEVAELRGSDLAEPVAAPSMAATSRQRTARRAGRDA